MSYNATIDVSSLDIMNDFKYDQNPLYEKSLRNIKYLPYDANGLISDNLIDFFNAMIVRRDTEYYEKSRSKSNYFMENLDVNKISSAHQPSGLMNSIRNELKDYLKLYNDFTNSLNNIDPIMWKQYPIYDEYKYIVNRYTIPEIIRLNKLIYLYISIPNNVPKDNIKKNINNYIIIIGIIILLIILFLICTKSKTDYD